ncbi:MAG: hypothetical protein GX879_02230 [Bacteroidales bacterium]|nr:hypothetical protein [Bacteroidales bacterium]
MHSRPPTAGRVQKQAYYSANIAICKLFKETRAIILNVLQLYETRLDIIAPPKLENYRAATVSFTKI